MGKTLADQPCAENMQNFKTNPAFWRRDFELKNYHF